MEDPFRKQQASDKVAKSFGNSRFTFWLVGIGVFLFVIILGVTFFKYKSFTKNELINFAPVDSVVYFSAHNSFWSWKDKTLAQLPYENFYLNTQFDFAQKLLPLSSHTATVKFLIDGKLESIWLFKLLSDAPENSSWAFELPGYQVFDKNILAVSSSAKALEKIADVYANKTFSLASQIQPSQALASFYVNAENLKTFLNYQDSSRNKILNQLLAQDLYLTFAKNKDSWTINLNQDTPLEKSSNQNLVTTLPTDFSIFISSINLSNLFTQWATADKSLGRTFEQSQEIYKQVFDFDLSTVGKEVLSNPADVIVFSQNDSALGLDYVLVMKQPSDLGIQNFHKLVKVILAQKLPQKAIRYLPDGSSVTELSADTEAWQWEVGDIDGEEIRFIVEPELNFSIYYILRDDKLIIAGTLERLTSFIQNSGINLVEYKSSCVSDIFSNSFMIFAKNSQIDDMSQLLPTNSLILGQKHGCIVDL